MSNDKPAAVPQGEAPRLIEPPFRKQLTVILFPDKSVAQAEKDLRAVVGGASSVLRIGPPAAYFHGLRLAVAKDPSVREKVAVFYEKDGELVEITLDPKEELRWPAGFDTELWELETEISHWRGHGQPWNNGQCPKCKERDAKAAVPQAEQHLGAIACLRALTIDRTDVSPYDSKTGKCKWCGYTPLTQHGSGCAWETALDYLRDVDYAGEISDPVFYAKAMGEAAVPAAPLRPVCICLVEGSGDASECKWCHPGDAAPLPEGEDTEAAPLPAPPPLDARPHDYCPECGAENDCPHNQNHGEPAPLSALPLDAVEEARRWLTAKGYNKLWTLGRYLKVASILAAYAHSARQAALREAAEPFRSTLEFLEDVAKKRAESGEGMTSAEEVILNDLRRALTDAGEAQKPQKDGSK